MDDNYKKILAHRESNKKYREKKRLENPFKRCSGCGEIKPIEEFAFSYEEQRYKSKCKVCRHNSYIAQRQKALERANKYYQENKELIKEKQQKRRKANLAKEILRSAKQRAKEKGLDFNIDLTDINIPEVCPVLGIPLVSGEGKAHDGSPSIDRIDSTKGYVKGNVIIVSYLANTIKTNATVEQIRRVADFYEKLQNK